MPGHVCKALGWLGCELKMQPACNIQGACLLLSESCRFTWLPPLQGCCCSTGCRQRWQQQQGGRQQRRGRE